MISSFTELKLESVCTEKLINLIPNLTFSLVYGQNEAALIDVDLLREDSQIFNLIQHFQIGLNKKSAIYRFSPMSSYTWHTDGIRSCAINLLLVGENSKTIFGDRKGMFYYNLEIVPYLKNRYYLLNTGKYHSVYNFSNNYRYLLSLGISKDWSVEDVMEYIRKNEL